MKLTLKEIGKNGLLEIREQLDNFVRDNFDLLYEGAVKLGINIPSDYYAPRRIQHNATRLHENTDVKYADGHKYNSDSYPSEQQLKQTIKDIQDLIDSAAEDIKPPFKIEIIEN